MPRGTQRRIRADENALITTHCLINTCCAEKKNFGNMLFVQLHFLLCKICIYKYTQIIFTYNAKGLASSCNKYPVEWTLGRFFITLMPLHLYRPEINIGNLYPMRII